VANDRLIRKLQQVDVVRRDLAAFLDRLGVAIRAGIANLRRGVPVSDQTQDAAAVHVELVQKLDDMHHAVHQARAEGVRVLVEDEGAPGEHGRPSDGSPTSAGRAALPAGSERHRHPRGASQQQGRSPRRERLGRSARGDDAPAHRRRAHGREPPDTDPAGGAVAVAPQRL
jgi:hypothetical protein